ncbi:MAG: 2-dehydropantoate 2-reductase N-terminal domain-containing protein [Gemmatimonadales bacterium]
MEIAVVGTGYVGLVVGACLAETGNHVVGAAIDENKIQGLQDGRIPIYEPGLDLLISRNVAEKRLRFTTDIGAAVLESEVIFIAVGTPPDEDGSADLQHVLDVARVIGQSMTEGAVVITKSTVPVGTARLVREEIEKMISCVPIASCAGSRTIGRGRCSRSFTSRSYEPATRSSSWTSRPPS